MFPTMGHVGDPRDGTETPSARSPFKSADSAALMRSSRVALRLQSESSEEISTCTLD
jgi:hypothetical protein